MTIKRFCDICEKELGRNVVSERLRPTFFRDCVNWYAEVQIRKGVVWNDGDMCIFCLRELLAADYEWKIH